MKIRILLPFLILLPLSAFAGTAVRDTIDIYGGPATLEGKFQNAVGEPDSQGWIGVDDTVPPLSEHWGISTINAANLDPEVADNHAWWCGEEMPACSQTDSAWGYGNDWCTAIGTSRTIDPTVRATMELTATLNLDTEPAYDFLRVEAMTAGGPVLLAELDGKLTGYELSVAHTWQPGDFVGEAGDEIGFRLLITSDASWSNADCLLEGVGAVQVDNLTTAVTQPGGLEYAAQVETCEPGDPAYWAAVQVDDGLGNFAQLWTGLDDIDPDQDNFSPQWAFLNDGEVVPELDPSYCWDKCYGPDSLSIYYGSEELRNSILSPPIELPAGWGSSLLVSFDAYQDPADCYSVFLRCGMMATDDPAGETGWNEEWYDFLIAAAEPGYGRIAVPVDDAMVPLSSRFVRIKIQAYAFMTAWCWGPQDSPAPYLDNVRLQVLGPYESDTPAAPVFTCSAAPNPFNPQVVIRWDLPRADDLEIRIHDARGRLVRALRSGAAAAGPGQAIWRGRDDAGRTAAAGVYFCSVKSSVERRWMKLTLLK